jgi:hypothetical protein
MLRVSAKSRISSQAFEAKAPLPIRIRVLGVDELLGCLDY